MQGKRWVFTLNNYEADDLLRLRELPVRYLVFGFENAPDTGTRHLQGFVIFDTNKRFNAAKEAIGTRAHLELAHGTSAQAAQYCKKEGNYEERGDIPNEQGKRNDWERLREWIDELGRKPTERELCTQWPHLVGRYGAGVDRVVSAMCPPIVLTTSEPRAGWQARLDEILDGEPDARKVYFYVDINGNTGKSWFCQHMMSTKPTQTQILRVGRRDDLAHSIDESKTIFLFDVPRQMMKFFQYSVCEMLKDRMVYSPKYASKMKILPTVPHVVVFSNEPPDKNAMSRDRYAITHLLNV